jgi:hypothetical protein
VLRSSTAPASLYTLDQLGMPPDSAATYSARHLALRDDRSAPDWFGKTTTLYATLSRSTGPTST